MDETTIAKLKKRNHDSAFESHGSFTSHIESDEKESLASLHSDGKPVHLKPSLKKPKYAPPRPLRLLKPTSLSGQVRATSSTSSNALESSQIEFRSLNHQEEAQKLKHRKIEPPSLGSGSFDKDESSWNCIYCKKSIEGGEAGKRRHQAGQKHLLQVQKSISKYVAPAMIPLLQINFPAHLSFDSQPHAILSYTNSQIQEYHRVASYLSAASSGTDLIPEISSIRGTTLDIDFLIALMIIKPKNLANEITAPEHVYTVVCRLKNQLPLQSMPSLCVFCEGNSAVKGTAHPPETYGSAAVALNSSPTEWNEHQLLEFWRHLASDAHKKAVSKLWREHHIRAPVAQLASRKGSSQDLRQAHGNDEKVHTPIHLQPASYFEAPSYSLSQAQLQKKLENWSRMKQFISSIPARNSTLQEETSTLEVLPLTQYSLPALGNAPGNHHLCIKDKIKKLIVPGAAKKGERVGSKWAEAVKAFKASNNLTTLQLLQLSRLERLASPNKQRTKWLPNFGGVWNETTRADHARSFTSQFKK